MLKLLFGLIQLIGSTPEPTYDLNPQTYKGGLDATQPKVFLSFFLEDKTSAPDVFSSCSFIPRANFETSSVMVSRYGY